MLDEEGGPGWIGGGWVVGMEDAAVMSLTGDNGLWIEECCALLRPASIGGAFLGALI